MIRYETKTTITAAAFIDVLERSTLSERRPVNEPERIQKMLDHAPVLVTAWDGDVKSHNGLCFLHLSIRFGSG
jgi:hypothetical protein